MEDENVWIDIYAEAARVCESMIKHGGSFERALAEALKYADIVNIMRIKQAFLDYWKGHLCHVCGCCNQQQPGGVSEKSR